MGNCTEWVCRKRKKEGPTRRGIPRRPSGGEKSRTASGRPTCVKTGNSSAGRRPTPPRCHACTRSRLARAMRPTLLPNRHLGTTRARRRAYGRQLQYLRPSGSLDHALRLGRAARCDRGRRGGTRWQKRVNSSAGDCRSCPGTPLWGELGWTVLAYRKIRARRRGRILEQLRDFRPSPPTAR